MITKIIDLMRALDYVLGSQHLTSDEKRAIALELKASLPAKALCSSAHVTHEIATSQFAKAAGLDIVRSNGTSTGSRDPAPPQEETQEKHELPGLRPREDGVSRDDRKKAGRPKKVARG